MKRSRRMGVLFALIDVGATLVVFNVVGWLRGVSPVPTFLLGPLIFPVLVTVAVIYLIDGYDTRTDMMGLDYTSQHTIALLSAMVFVLLATFVLIGAGYVLQSSRAVIALSYALLIPVTLSYRRAWTARAGRQRNGRQLVFIGDASSYKLFKTECEQQRTAFKTILATATAPAVETTDPNLPELLARIERGELEIEGVVLREGGLSLEPSVAERLVQLHFRGVPTYTLELFHETYWRKIPLYRLNPTWLFQEGFQIAREPVFERLKRISDVGLAGLGVVLFAPLIAAAAAAIWLEDRGPVFFAQSRIGRHKRSFRLFKLRTMRTEPKATDDRYTRPGDTRITKVGRVLRATRIDEFPQLWSVLQGDMSLIGPRAEWDRLVADYEKAIPCYHFRHMVRPGITGWAQVNYPYGASIDDTLRKLEYDLYYIRHFSFVLDASIVLKTIHIMVTGKGSR